LEGDRGKRPRSGIKCPRNTFEWTRKVSLGEKKKGDPHREKRSRSERRHAKASSWRKRTRSNKVHGYGVTAQSGRANMAREEGEGAGSKWRVTEKLCLENRKTRKEVRGLAYNKTRLKGEFRRRNVKRSCTGIGERMDHGRA